MLSESVREQVEALRELTKPRPVFDAEGNFQGHESSPCGEHRTVGEHRAWCHACTEWCYPTMPCLGCGHADELTAAVPLLLERSDLLDEAVELLREYDGTHAWERNAERFLARLSPEVPEDEERK